MNKYSKRQVLVFVFTVLPNIYLFKIIFIVKDIEEDTKKTITYQKKDKHNSSWILNENCLKPLQKPIIGVHDLSRIINVGMPKCGSTSLAHFFKADYHTSHWNCGKEIKAVGKCGTCMQDAVKKNLLPLSNCGNFTVFAQMDYFKFDFNEMRDLNQPLRSNEKSCTFPQITYLNEIYQEAPNATFILPFRNVSSWINSISKWNNMRKRFEAFCDFSELGITKNNMSLTEDKNLILLYCNHVKKVRRFVLDRPSLSLIEFSIEDPNAGYYLSSFFPLVNASHWGQVNKKYST